MTQIREGSTKKIIPHFNRGGGKVTRLTFDFSQDTVSVFDVGPIPVPFNGLGRLRCAIAGKVFIEMNEAGFNTHYLSHDAEAATMDVLPCDIPDKDIQYFGAVGRVLGVEILDRLVVTPKFLKRIKDGELDQARIEKLLNEPLEVGARLSSPFIECSTKFESADRYLQDEEVPDLAKVGKLYLQQSVWPEVKKSSLWQKNFFRSAGFDRRDGKVEGAFVYHGDKFMFVDCISPDELRLIGPDGRSHDKDPVRNWYEITFPDWKRELDVAKEEYPDDSSQWPTYPDVPPQVVIDDVYNRYCAVAEAIGAI